jgi:hypothetical protein
LPDNPLPDEVVAVPAAPPLLLDDDDVPAASGPPAAPDPLAAPLPPLQPPLLLHLPLNRDDPHELQLLAGTLADFGNASGVVRETMGLAVGVPAGVLNDFCDVGEAAGALGFRFTPHYSPSAYLW